ncbi:hypothetical protein [Luteibacter sp.]|uniref:hypothetical protein n=1 Tax=Luteibacter sp. TaxID=1886636 RepID=UPI003F7DF1F0
MSHGTLTKIRGLGLCTILFAACGVADARIPDGQWSGVLRAGDDATRVVAMRRGEKLQLRFREPHNCQLPAELLDEKDGEAQFRFNPPPNGGGFCAGLYPGDVLIREGESSLRLAFERSGRAWSGDLSPSPAPWGKR